MGYTPNATATASQFLTFRASLAKVLAASARSRILFIGDSTTDGVGSSTSTRMPDRFAAMLTSAGYTAYSNTRMGVSALTDSAVTLNSWTNGAAAGNLANGGFNIASAAGGSTLSFTPPNSFDRITTVHVTLSGHGTVVMNVDGGSTLATLVGNGSSGLTTTTTNCTAGTHTINVVGSSGGTFYLRSIEAWSSTAPAVSIFNGGKNALVASQVNGSNPYGDFALIDAIDPDLSIISLTINDSNNATALSTYISSLKAIADRCALSGSVLIVGGLPSSPEPANYAAYLAACRNIGYPCILLTDRWGNYTAANAQGFMSDSLHGSATGYADWARFIFRALEI